MKPLSARVCALTNFSGALVIASAQSLNIMVPPDNLRAMVEWYISEVARMAMPVYSYEVSCEDEEH
jgi:hypothetical protein